MLGDNMDPINEEALEDEDEYLDAEENIYSEKTRDNLLDDDELSPDEEAFMRGYEEAF